MPFTYTAMSAFVLDQYFGRQSVNKLKDNMRYIEEDVLRDPAINSNNIDILLLDGAASHGGEILWSGGSSKYLRGDSAGLYGEFGGANLDLTLGKKFKGNRVLVGHADDSDPTLSSSRYLNLGAAPTTECGMYMPFAGSILSISARAQAQSIAAGQGGNRIFEVHKNGVNVFSTTLSWTDTEDNQYKGGYSTQARGVDTFVATDRIDTYINFSSGTFDIQKYYVLLELLIDTY